MQTHLLYKQAFLLDPDRFSLWTGGGVALILGRWGYQADMVSENRRIRFVVMFFYLSGFGCLFLVECAHSD